MPQKISQYVLLATGVCLLLAWLLPNHYPPWLSFPQDFAAFTALLLAGFSLALRRGPVPLPLLACGALLLALVPLAQAMTEHLHFAGDGWVAAIYLAAFALAVIVGAGLTRQHGASAVALALATCMLFTAVLAAALAIFQWLQLDGLGIYRIDLKPGGRPFGNLGQPNNHASLLWLGLMSALYFFERRHIGGFTLALLAAWLVFAIAMTQSRTSWLGAGLLLLWWLWRGRSMMRLHGAALLAGLLVYALLVLQWPLIVEWLGAVGNDDVRSAEVGVRRLMWLQMLDAALQKPWFGWGWNQVSVAQVAVALDHPPVGYTEHSHNLFIDLLVWNGLPIGGLTIAALLWWGATRAWATRSPESMWAMLALGGLFIHGLLEFPLEYAYFLLPAGVLMGLVEQVGRSDLNTTCAGACRSESRPATHHVGPRARSLPPWALGLLVVAGVGLATLVWREYRLIEEDNRLMRFESARIGTLRAEQPAPDVLMLSQLREFLRFARTEAQPGMTAEELVWMGQISHRFAYASSLFRHALALAYNGQPEAAALELQRMRKLHREHFYAEAYAAIQTQAASTHPQLAALLPLLEAPLEAPDNAP